VKILFDHNVPYGLRSQLVSHQVSLADELGWARIANGELLRVAEETGFEVMVTCDQNLSYQQNLTSRKIAFVVLNTNNWKMLKADAPTIVEAIDNAAPGSFCYLTIETRSQRRRKVPNL